MFIFTYLLNIVSISRSRYFVNSVSIDIYTVDTVLPFHIVWHEEATAKSTTQDGGMAETSVNGR